jgi:hypothetical protein
MQNYYTFSLAAMLLATTAMPALAQEAQTVPVSTDPVAVQQGVISYTPADFAASRPNTALEMINRLPGFSFDGGDNVRGFAGAAGNVLIDGQRPTSKTDGLGDTLARIPIDQVERIDLIRGGSTGIDMQGQTVVANVIRKKVDTFQQVLTLRSFLFSETGKTIPGWNYQATRRVDDHQFDVSFGRGISMDDSVGTGWRTTVDAATGNLTLFEQARTEGDGAVHSLRGSYKGPQFGGTLSLNGLLSTDEFKSESYFTTPTTSEAFVNRSANDRGEVGINFTIDLTPELEWESLGLAKLAVGSLDATGVTGSGSQLFQVEAEAGERIARSVLRYALSPELSFEGGGEVAYNYREQQVALALDGIPFPLPASDVLVEETRGEAFVQGSWRPALEWTLEGGIRVERSTITQSGDTDRERSFTYPKPRFVATWSPSKDDQLRFRAEREIGQLNFQDFASEVNLNSGQQSTGNSDLEPSKAWVYEATYEKRFWDGAAAVFTYRHQDISDVVDLFPRDVMIDTDNDGIPDTPALLVGPGNIGDGTNDTLIFNLTLPLANLGLKGAEFKIESQWDESEVTDPLTGEKRRISGQRPDDVNLTFRQDLPEQNLTFGFGWFKGWEENYYQVDNVENLTLKNFYHSFIEWKPDPGFTLRAELNNLDPFKFNIEREIYGGRRDQNPLVSIETERRNSQVLGMLSARWTFN